MELRVATALCEIECAQQARPTCKTRGCLAFGRTNFLTIETKNRLLTKARAAIRAMREPTRAMEYAGCAEAAVGDQGESLNPEPSNAWRAMIDAASPPESP